MAVEGQVFSCDTIKDWKDQFENDKNTQKLVVVDFFTTWCGPCHFISPVLTDLAKKHTHVRFLKVDVDKLREVAEEYNVEVIPTFIFMKQGQVIDTFVGAKKDELLAKIEKHVAITSTA